MNFGADEDDLHVFPTKNRLESPKYQHRLFLVTQVGSGHRCGKAATLLYCCCTLLPYHDRPSLSSLPPLSTNKQKNWLASYRREVRTGQHVTERESADGRSRVEKIAQ